MKNYDSVVDLLYECAADAHGMARLRDALGVGVESGWQQRCLAEVADMIEDEFDAECNKLVSLEIECGRLYKALADMERTHMKLPVDADGVPIRPGDLIESEYMSHGPMTVADVGRLDAYAYNEHGKGFLIAKVCHHVKTDTVESLLGDFLKDIVTYHNVYVPDWEKDEFKKYLRELRDNYAERIRKARINEK